MEVVNRWSVDGKNYGETSEQWLRQLDKHKTQALEILTKAYGGNKTLGTAWFYRWRVFYLAVAELFNYQNGQEWFVVHYLFKKRH